MDLPPHRCSVLVPGTLEGPGEAGVELRLVDQQGGSGGLPDAGVRIRLGSPQGQGVVHGDQGVRQAFDEHASQRALADTAVTVLPGGRRPGKSTPVTQLAQEFGVAVHTMDDDALRQAAQADPAAFVASLGDASVVLAEVQRAPQLVLPATAAVDRDRSPGRFLLSGSADLMRAPGAEDSLAGRASTFELSPFAPGELAVAHDRESGRTGVDLVPPLPGGRVIGVEATATTAPTATQFQGLRTLGERLADDRADGVLCYLGSCVLLFGDGL